METLAYSLAVLLSFPISIYWVQAGAYYTYNIYLHEMTSIKMLSSYYSVSYSDDICYLYRQGHWGNIAARQNM
jgi:hypothetical protein